MSRGRDLTIRWEGVYGSNRLSIRAAILNAHRILRRKYLRQLLWVLVGDLFGCGSTTAVEICRAVNMNPNQLCRCKHPQEFLTDE